MKDEEKRCENCIHNEEHLKAIQEGKQGSAICMLECNPNHICFIPKRKGNVKDEEMAEEYVDRTRIVDENTRVGTDCISLVQDYEGNYIDIHERIKQAFLAGLKAGRLQWHDLRKYPNDLPKEVGNYLVCYIDTMLNRNVFILEFVDFLEDSHWIDETSHEIEKFDEGVIAWCEIPTFDKE